MVNFVLIGLFLATYVFGVAIGYYIKSREIKQAQEQQLNVGPQQ